MYLSGAAQEEKNFFYTGSYKPLMIANNCRKCYHWFPILFLFLKTKPAVYYGGFCLYFGKTEDYILLGRGYL